MKRRGRTLFLAVALIGAALQAGCSAFANEPPPLPPPPRAGFTPFGPGGSREDVLAAVSQHADAIGDDGIMLPVGVRGPDDDMLIIDVLFVMTAQRLTEVLPESHFPASDKSASQGAYRWLVRHNAVDGKGFALRYADGRAILTRRLDLAPSLESATRARYGLAAELEAPTARVTVRGRLYTATILPVPIGCKQRAPVGADVCVRLRKKLSTSWAPSSSEEFCGTVTSSRRD